MSISLNSTTSSNGNTSSISGLASGMDTDSIIEGMMSASQAKIDKVNQQKQLLEWKQENYTTIISKLKTFKDKYFGSSTSSSSSLSSAFYSSKVAATANEADSKYVSVTTSDSTNISALNLSNIQIATQSVAKTAQTASSQITMGFDLASAPVDLTGKTFDMTVNGTTRTLTLSKSYSTAQELATDIQQLANDAFGTDRVSVTNSGDNIIMNSDGTSVSLAAGSTNDAFSVSGFSLINSQTSRVDLTKSIAENSFATAITGDSFAFTINGKSFDCSSSDSISSIINKINKSDCGAKISYSSITDKFSLTSTATGSDGALTISDETGNFLTSIIGPLTAENYTQGTNASVYIDGAKVTRSSNTFTIDDITYNLKANTSNSIDISITDNTSKALENIKNFVSDYNDLLGSINTKLNEKYNNDYLPLTDAQKDEMSESEIEKWTEKAKTGLLKNDSTLSSIASSLRAIMYTPVANLADNSTNLSVTMASIGISTSGYSSQGKLVIDEDKLTEALKNNCQGVIDLFTQSSDKTYLAATTSNLKKERYNESGIMNRISDLLENSVGTLYGKGSLLKIAGYEGTSTEKENTITRSIKRYNQKLDQLLDAFKLEETRYRSQFTSMETYINQMNTTASYLSNSFS
ncbi:MAG: flagellar filament capping protein FliD [Oscillospiraceae bacterium]|nr:flagellar filament capping protein FliD [Oscillospiraceae bacterium]